MNNPTIWNADHETLSGGKAERFVIKREGVVASYRDVLHGWREDALFRTWFIGILAGVSYSAFRWETPRVTRGTFDEPFEFVLLDSPTLTRAAEVSAFEEHFQKRPDLEVVSFANLGRDAILVVPCPRGPDATYMHLASFTRQGPVAQQHALWREVAIAMEQRVSDKPVWLSTAGAGVAWLHVRLDDRPKYYGYAPYRAAK